MEVKAIAKTVRISPRKVRLVVDLIRGKSVGEAISILRLSNQGSSVAIEKVVKSAVANAVNNNNLNKDLLYIKKAFVDEGITMKRYRPRAKGSGNQILKRTSNITVVLEEKQ